MHVHTCRCGDQKSRFGWLPQLLLYLLLLFGFSCFFGCLLGYLGEEGWVFLCWRKDLLLNLNILPGWLTGPWASGIFLHLSLHLPLCTEVTDVCCCTSVHYVDSGDLNPGLLTLALRALYQLSRLSGPVFCFFCMRGFVPHNCFGRLFCSTLYSWQSPAWISAALVESILSHFMNSPQFIYPVSFWVGLS